LGLRPDEHQSPAVLRKMIQAGVRNHSYQEASRELRESAELEINAKAVERAVQRIGQERITQRTAAEQAYAALSLPQQQSACPLPLAPQVAVVEFDCGRMLIRERERKRAAAATEVPSAEALAEAAASRAEQAAEAAWVLSVDAACGDVSAEPTTAEMAAAEPSSPSAASRGEEECRSQFWRDHKVGVLLTMTSRAQAEDPCPHIPATFVDAQRVTKLVRELGGRGGARQAAEKPAAEQPPDPVKPDDRPGRPQPRVKTIVASRLCSAAFGAVLVAAAWARGFAAAPRKAFVADGASMNWTMHARYFSHYVPILDFIHALQYVFAAALAGRAFAAGWLIYGRWIQAVWSGHVAQVIAELQQRQAELGLPPKEASSTDPRRIVATALGYLRTHQSRMDYARYRRLGLPLMSSHVESAVKQINRRVKGTEKFWCARGAEPMLQLRADYLSDTHPLDTFWQQRQQKATGQRSYSCAL
jgi:hypothetical protein